MADTKKKRRMKRARGANGDTEGTANVPRRDSLSGPETHPSVPPPVPDGSSFRPTQMNGLNAQGPEGHPPHYLPQQEVGIPMQIKEEPLVEENEEDPEEEDVEAVEAEEATVVPEDEAKEYIMQLYAEEQTADEIVEHMKEEGLVDQNGVPYKKMKVLGWKRAFPRWKKEHGIEEETDEEEEEVPPEKTEAAIVPPVASTPIVPPPNIKEMFNFTRRTKLDVFYEMLKEARDMVQNDPTNPTVIAMAEGQMQMAVEGIYKEMDKMDEKPFLTQMMGVMTGMLTDKGKTDPFDQLEKMTNIVGTMMGNQGNSDAVEMAKVVSGTVSHATTELKDTVLLVTGKKDESSKVGKCPYCGKLVPVDSKFCSYCGGNFTVQEETAPNPEDQAADKRSNQIEVRKQEMAGALTMPPVQSQNRADFEIDEDWQEVDVDAQRVNGSQRKPNAPQPLQTSNAVPPDLLRHIKKLSNFIAAKDDPVIKADAAWKMADTIDKTKIILLISMGPGRLFRAAAKAINDYPDFQRHYEICTSVDGQQWITSVLDEFKDLARKERFEVSRKEFEKLQRKWEANLGFRLE